MQNINPFIKEGILGEKFSRYIKWKLFRSSIKYKLLRNGSNLHI